MKLLKLILPMAFIGLSSCGKTEESIVDCLGESFLTNVEHSASAENVKTINFTVGHSGEQQLNNSIKWNFGDGAQQTVTGKSANHTYAQAGVYNAIATVTTSGGCTFDVKETVNVQ